MEKFRKKILGKMIAKAVPILNLFRPSENWSYSINDLLNLDKESWGHQMGKMLQSKNLNILPNYARHDALHTLLGYGTSIEGELKLQSFMWGNKTATFAGKGLLLLGFIFFPKKHPIFEKHIKRGKEARRICWNQIPSQMTFNINQIRKYYNL